MTECVIVVQSQLPRKEWEHEFFYGNSVNVTNVTANNTENVTVHATKKINANYTENVTAHATKKMSTQTLNQISRSTLLTTLLPTTPSPTLVTIDSSTSQHKKLAEKYSSMSFMDFMNVSGMGEKSLTALLRKFLFF